MPTDPIRSRLRNAWAALRGHPTPNELEAAEIMDDVADKLATARVAMKNGLDLQMRQAVKIIDQTAAVQWAAVLVNALVLRLGGSVTLTDLDLSRAGATLETDRDAAGGLTIRARMSD